MPEERGTLARFGGAGTVALSIFAILSQPILEAAGMPWVMNRTLSCRRRSASAPAGPYIIRS